MTATFEDRKTDALPSEPAAVHPRRVEPQTVARECLGNRGWLKLLGTTLDVEHAYEAEIEGTFPSTLAGVLYRNGPGRFDRGGVAKRNLLDGDGMVQRFGIREGRVTYRNRFVRTDKFVAEEAAGRLLYATWTTKAPGSLLRNFGARGFQSQAGITVYRIGERVIATDEVGLPWEIDPDTLETIGEVAVGRDGGQPMMARNMALKAHQKVDPVTGDWILVGNSYGRVNTIEAIVHGRDGALRTHRSYPVPRMVYIHDFAVSEHFIVVLLHPAMISPVPFLTGLRSFTDSIRWTPEAGNLVMIMDRHGERDPVFLEAPAAYMWHALNAYEEDGEIVVDFAGYDAPDHMFGSDPILSTVMHGETGADGTAGTLRRYRLDPAAGRVDVDTLFSINLEFPYVHPVRVGRRHRYGYFTTAAQATIFHNGVTRLDLETGDASTYHFDSQTHVGEPVFVPAGKPDNDSEPGWVLTVGLDGKTGRSFLAVFDAETIAAGPLGLARLRHATPLSFHGDFVPTP